jgi:hypothetical protein
MRIKLTILITFCAAFTGLNCVPRTVIKTEYVEVKVPVRCNVTIPPRPTYNSDPVMGVIDVLEYTEKLETLLKACTQ